jgi:integrase
MRPDHKTLSEKTIAALPAPETGNKLHYFSGAVLQGRKAPPGFGVRVTAAGHRSFVLFHRVNGKKYLRTIGSWTKNESGGTHSALQAVIAARALLDEIHAPGSTADPRPERTRTIEDKDKAKGETINDLLDRFVDRYVEKDAKLRSAPAIKNALDRLVRPRIGELGIYDVRRSQIMNVLDEIADENGPVASERVLSYLRKAFFWHAKRDDDFTPPIIPGMGRVNAKERQRNRILTDDEIRKIWNAAGENAFGKLVRFLLLSGARLREAAHMKRDEIDGTLWTLPAARNKAKADLTRPLTKAMRELIAGEGEWAFSHDGRRRLGGFSWLKDRLAKNSGTSGWTLHDLRRTARSLMSRAGVPSDHAERCLGHVIPGVRGVYDQHKYAGEMLAAYEALDKLLTRILKPSANVTELAGRRKGRGAR